MNYPNLPNSEQDGLAVEVPYNPNGGTELQEGGIQVVFSVYFKDQVENEEDELARINNDVDSKQAIKDAVLRTFADPNFSTVNPFSH